jgi:hypothetical protein
VTVFETDTPIPLIEAVKPDIYAKGGDYSPQMLEETATVEAYGGQVSILDYVSEHSTTAVVRRIRGTAAGIAAAAGTGAGAGAGSGTAVPTADRAGTGGDSGTAAAGPVAEEAERA